MFSQHPDIAKRWAAEGKGYVANTPERKAALKRRMKKHASKKQGS